MKNARPVETKASAQSKRHFTTIKTAILSYAPELVMLCQLAAAAFVLGGCNG